VTVSMHRKETLMPRRARARHSEDPDGTLLGKSNEGASNSQSKLLLLLVVGMDQGNRNRYL
jgi:hypothetical protein